MSELNKTSNEVIQNNLDYTLFSWSKQAGLNPIQAERAEGVYVYTAEGSRIIDFSSQLMNVNIGLEIQITKAVDLQTQNIITNGIKHATMKTIALWIKMVKA